jgi:hypothetical protein
VVGGYAEGLGRPVIYTCRRDVFEDRKSENHPHFDTNHMVTVPWDPADPASAAPKLKDTIRATLPTEALLTDEANLGGTATPSGPGPSGP